MSRNVKVKGKITKRIIFHTLRGLTSPHRHCVTSFSQLKSISQSGKDMLFYFMFSLTFEFFGMFVSYRTFQIQKSLNKHHTGNGADKTCHMQLMIFFYFKEK